MKKFLIFLALLPFAAAIAQSQPEKVDYEVIAKIKEEGTKNSKIMDIIFNLTDVLGPRLTASPGLKNAEEWTRKQLADWGLANAQLESWGGFGKGWETKRCYIAMTVPYYQPLIAVPKAWTPGTNGAVKGKPVLMKIDSISDIDKYKGQLKGKIVIVTTSSSMEIKPGFEPDAKRYTDEELKKLTLDQSFDFSTEESPARTSERERYRGLRTLYNKLSAFIQEEGPALVISARRGDNGTLFTSNGASYSVNAKPVPAELEMSAEHVNRLVRLLQAKKEVEIEADIQNVFTDKDTLEYNVVAEIPGTDKTLKAEIVMLGGHLDSWHGATGATDNAAGVAVAMEAVRILKAIGIQPRRTIRIALWSGEEQGLYGSRGYVKNHFANRETMELKPEHSKLSAYYNLDNGTGRIRGIYMQGNDALRPIFEAWLAPFHGMGAATVTSRNTGSTDHVPFDAVGLPGFQFIQDPLDYNSRTHHTNMDVYDRIQEDDMKQAAIIMASFVYHTAMRDQKLPRKELPKPQPKTNTGGSVGGGQ